MIWRQNRSGVTPSRLPDYLGHEFLVRMYVCIFAYTRTIICCYCILQIFHESMRWWFGRWPAIFPSRFSLLSSFPENATKLSGCREIYSRQSEIVTEYITTIKYFEYWLLTGIEISTFRTRPHEISRGIKYDRTLLSYNVRDLK